MRTIAQAITIKVKLQPTKAQAKLLHVSGKEYISVINTLVQEMVQDKVTTKKTTKDVQCKLPSALKNQAIRDAKSVFSKAKKSNYSIIPILKKPSLIWNNQNHKHRESEISIPLLVDGKSKRIHIKALFTNDLLVQLSQSKLGTLRITQKSKKWIAQFSVEVQTPLNTGTKIMGVDLGLKVPAVAVTENEKTKFFGNGRHNKYEKRKFRAKRKALGKAKKQKAINKINNKEQRWMQDKDHKVSREIVDFALQNKVAIIRLEKLANIRKTAKTSRKNVKNLHTWSFYRLASFIEYKANLVGIQVEYVNPAYTSQTCPVPTCGKRNKAKGRAYYCACGFSTHRDRVGAMNIRYAPVMDGNSLSA